MGTVNRLISAAEHERVLDMMICVVILGLIFTREVCAAAVLEKCAQLSTGNYSFVENPMSWFEADSYCKSLGAKLVEIDSEEENAAIVEGVNRGGYKDRLMYFWIGLTDKDKERTWTLASNGVDAGYLNWDTSFSSDPEPNPR